MEEREGNGVHHVDFTRDAGDALPFLACQHVHTMLGKEKYKTVWIKYWKKKES